MGITLSMTGRSGKPERPSFLSRRAHLLTTCPQGWRWYPSRWSGRALFPKHPPDASPEGADNAAVFQTVVIACAAGRRPLPRLPLCSKPLSPSETSCLPPAKTCRWQLYRSYGRCIPSTVHFLLYAPKETKTPPCGEQKGSDPLWRSIIWKLRS